MQKRYWALSIVCSLFSAVLVVLALWLPTQYKVPVMTYHTISPSSFEPLNNVRPESFARQMAYLKRQGYKVLTLAQFVDDIIAGRRHDRKSVVITFDDGYQDNYTAAYPVLKKFGFPATVFVEVDHLGNPGRLTWAQALQMDAGGVRMESHVMTGAYLPSAPPEKLVYEVTESKRVLEMELGRPVHFLAYPIGGFSEDVKRIVREAGYKAAFTTNRGYDRAGKDLYEIKRIRIKDSDGDLQLWLKLSGYYNLLRHSQKPF
jgi:peptidoglycan/xylan/chitin deacetylase (PgdA/CDA1 family)